MSLVLIEIELEIEMDATHLRILIRGAELPPIGNISPSGSCLYSVLSSWYLDRFKSMMQSFYLLW